MVNIPDPPSIVARMFQPEVMAEAEKRYPLVKMGKVSQLLFDVCRSWISIFKPQGSGTLQRHGHASSVTAWTMDGAWGYREHDWVARAGSFACEPAAKFTRFASTPAWAP